MTEPSTPLMRQYAAVKKEHPTALLFFRLGDFYELFFRRRDRSLQRAADHADFPQQGKRYCRAHVRRAVPRRRGLHRQADPQRLQGRHLRADGGCTADSGEKAGAARSHACRHARNRRGFVAGSDENNFLAALAQVGDRVGFAALDLSTGEFRATEFSGESALRRVQEELEQLRPKELLYGSAAPAVRSRIASARRSHDLPSAERRCLGSRIGCTETPLDDWIFAPDHAIPLLENHFGVLIARRIWPRGPHGRGRGGGGNPLLRPLDSTRLARSRRPHRLVRTPELFGARRGYGPQSRTDRAAVRRNRCGRHSVSLDRCRRHSHGQATSARLAAAPVARFEEINARLDAVEAGVKEIIAREELRRALDGVLDLERLLSRVTLETANPRDVLALAASLAKIPAIRAAPARLECRAAEHSARLAR